VLTENIIHAEISLDSYRVQVLTLNCMWTFMCSEAFSSVKMLQYCGFLV